MATSSGDIFPRIFDPSDGNLAFLTNVELKLNGM